MAKKLHSFFLIYFLFFGFSSSIFSESIVLRNGSFFVDVKILEQNTDEVTFQDQSGKKNIIQKTQVFKVVFKNITKEEALQIKKEEDAKLALAKSNHDKKRVLEEENKIKEKELNDILEAKRKEEEESQKIANISRTSVLWKSALIPGWGQWVQGRKTRAITFFALNIVGLGVVYGNQQNYLNAKNNYEEINQPSRNLFVPNYNFSLQSPANLFVYNAQFAGARDAVEKAETDRNLAVFGLVAVYLFNLVDVVYYNKNSSWFSNVSLDAKIQSTNSIWQSGPQALSENRAFGLNNGLEYNYSLKYFIRF